MASYYIELDRAITDAKELDAIMRDLESIFKRDVSSLRPRMQRGRGKIAKLDSLEEAQKYQATFKVIGIHTVINAPEFQDSPPPYSDEDTPYNDTPRLLTTRPGEQATAAVWVAEEEAPSASKIVVAHTVTINRAAGELQLEKPTRQKKHVTLTPGCLTVIFGLGLMVARFIF